VHRRVKGAYAVVAMIAGYGLLAFRDPHGIRPLIVGRADTEKGVEFLVASESVTLDTLGFKVMRDVNPGEAILVDESGNFHSRQCAKDPHLNPLHLRVRLPRAAGLGDRRHLGVREPPQHGAAASPTRSSTWDCARRSTW
jgi:asparagine synthetase B (glutamine-hydrolysing)